MRTSPLLAVRIASRYMSKPATAELSEVSRAAIKKAWANRFYRWRAYALSLTGNRTDAEEIVQEAITRTMKAAPHLATEQDAYHYVVAAIRSSAYLMFSRRGRQRQLGDEAALESMASDALGQAMEVEEAAQRKALTGAAIEALAVLTPLHRETVELLVLREPPMKLREVAAIQNAPISTVYSRLQAALRSLARELRKDSK
jgi:RNA polymerase sigma-70 factor (ECF subfamily)